MVEYGVNVANKFGFLSDDESEDPEVVLKRAETASKKDEKTASQKKADKNAAARRRKENLAAQSIVRDGDLKKTSNLSQKKTSDGNKENHPEGQPRGRGRGRPGRGRGGEHDRVGRPDRDDDGIQKDLFGDRFGENLAPRGRGRGRIGRGGARGFRGGRGGSRQPVDGDRSGDENNEILVHGDRENENSGGFTPRGGFRGGRGYRGGDRVFRGSRGGRRQFDRVDRLHEKQDNNENNETREQVEAIPGDDPANMINEGEKADEVLVPPREKTEEELRAEAEAEELAKQITLDEFKAQMAAKRQEPQFNTRKAGEGTNEKEFGKLVPLTKDIIQDAPEEEIIIVRREPRAKRLDIEINFTDEQRGGRGSRSGFRSGRGYRGGRNENRGSRRHDENFEMWAGDFPALGAGAH